MKHEYLVMLKELDNFDLICEWDHLNTMTELAKHAELDKNDFNHGLFEKEVDIFQDAVHDAINAFTDVMHKARIAVYNELLVRRIIE